MTPSELREAREARGWWVSEVAAALGVAPSTVRAWEVGKRQISAEGEAWWAAQAPLPAPSGPPLPPTREGLSALMAARGLSVRALAASIGVVYGTFCRWYTSDDEILNPRMRAWLARGAPPDWWPPAPRTADGSPLPTSARELRITVLPPQPGPGWIWLADEGGWAPPAAHCEPDDDYQKVVGCDVCAWRDQCAALRAPRKAS